MTKHIWYVCGSCNISMKCINQKSGLEIIVSQCYAPLLNQLNNGLNIERSPLIPMHMLKITYIDFLYVIQYIHQHMQKIIDIMLNIVIFVQWWAPLDAATWVQLPGLGN